VRWGRDLPMGEEVDVLLAEVGDPCPRCGEPMAKSRGIEVGHIFKLGTKYSELLGCNYLDVAGKSHPMPMGCYGLGIGRTVAAAIEQNHDSDGIIWPRPLAPFEILLVALNPKDAAVMEVADRLYAEMIGQGLDVLYDDRKERPGVKFKDADLIGVPLRVVVGKKGLAEGKIEISTRREREKEQVAQADVMQRALAWAHG
jgi:prolyl-tRNA synthetase